MTTISPEDPRPEVVAGFGFSAPGAADALTAAAVLAAADRLGLWDALTDRSATGDELAARLDLDPAGTAVLLRALASLDVVTRDTDGRYRPTVTAGAYRAVRQRWGGLEGSVRRRSQARLPDYSRVADVLADGVCATSDAIAEVLAPARTILDLGAGAAGHTRALARKRHDLEVTLVDWPAVLERALSRARDDGVDHRFQAVSGDLFEVDYGANYDVALLSGVLHLYDDEHCRILVQRAADALAVGGRVAVVEPLPDESMDGPLGVTLYAVGLYLRAPDGGVRAFSTYAAWLAAAGLVDVDRAELGPRRLSVVTARRPS